MSNLSVRPCRYLSTVTPSSGRASVDGFRRERLQEVGDCSLEFIKAAISKAELGKGFALTCPVTNFLGNAEVLIVVLYCSLEFSEGFISIAEIGIATSFFYPVTNFLGNADVRVVVLYCSLGVTEGLVSTAEIAIGTSK